MNLHLYTVVFMNHQFLICLALQSSKFRFIMLNELAHAYSKCNIAVSHATLSVSQLSERYKTLFEVSILAGFRQQCLSAQKTSRRCIRTGDLFIFESCLPCYYFPVFWCFHSALHVSTGRGFHRLWQTVAVHIKFHSNLLGSVFLCCHYKEIASNAVIVYTVYSINI